jgi:hypothetical protein
VYVRGQSHAQIDGQIDSDRVNQKVVRQYDVIKVKTKKTRPHGSEADNHKKVIITRVEPINQLVTCKVCYSPRHSEGRCTDRIQVQGKETISCYTDLEKIVIDGIWFI